MFCFLGSSLLWYISWLSFQAVWLKILPCFVNFVFTFLESSSAHFLLSHRMIFFIRVIWVRKRLCSAYSILQFFVFFLNLLILPVWMLEYLPQFFSGSNQYYNDCIIFHSSLYWLFVFMQIFVVSFHKIVKWIHPNIFSPWLKCCSKKSARELEKLMNIIILKSWQLVCSVL